MWPPSSDPGPSSSSSSGVVARSLGSRDAPEWVRAATGEHRDTDSVSTVRRWALADAWVRLPRGKRNDGTESEGYSGQQAIAVILVGGSVSDVQGN